LAFDLLQIHSTSNEEILNKNQNEVKELDNFLVPDGTNAVPKRAVLEGKTQSNMSTPKAEQTTKSNA
jgi:hypothetical protein